MKHRNSSTINESCKEGIIIKVKNTTDWCFCENLFIPFVLRGYPGYVVIDKGK